MTHSSLNEISLLTEHGNQPNLFFVQFNTSYTHGKTGMWSDFFARHSPPANLLSVHSPTTPNLCLTLVQRIHTYGEIILIFFLISR